MKISMKEKVHDIILATLSQIASGDDSVTELLAFYGMFKGFWLLKLIDDNQMQKLSEYITEKIEESEVI